MAQKEETKPVEKPTEEETETPKETKPTSIDEANAVLEKMEAANVKREELLEREERMRSDDMLGGKSSAGQAPLEVSEEEAFKQKGRDLVADSGLNPWPEKEKE